MTVIRPREPHGRRRACCSSTTTTRFTYNLAHLLCEAGRRGRRAPPRRRRRGRGATTPQPTHLVISPGPGRPVRDRRLGRADPRASPAASRCSACASATSCMVEVYGGEVEPRAASSCTARSARSRCVADDPLLAGLPTGSRRGATTRWRRSSRCPSEFVLTARDDDGEVMAMRHRDGAAPHGVQFHPESGADAGRADGSRATSWRWTARDPGDAGARCWRATT